MILLAFIGMSLAWSFSWFAMKLQVDSYLPPELSVFYRFFFASIFMFVLCFATRQRVALRVSELRFLVAIGVTNFCLNFLIGYFAVKFIPSGVMAVIFSLSIITSEVISVVVDGKRIEKKVLLSGFVGMVGLGFFIFPVVKFSADSKSLFGLALSITMMFVYSLGNVLVGKNKKINSTPLYTSIAYGSAFGAIFLLMFNLYRGNDFAFDFSFRYLVSFCYLVLVATVLAFICMFYLIQNIGSARANYTALVYPSIALITSSFFEGFNFTILSVIGFILIILALIIDFMPKKFVNF